MPQTTYDAQYWLERAEEVRQRAARMTNAGIKREMLAIAATYQRLADLAEERTAGKKAGR